MAITVPQYGDSKVNREGLPSVRIQPAQGVEEAAGGGASSAAVATAGRELNNSTQRIVAQQQQNADEVAVQEADLKAGILANKLNVDIKNMQGKDSLAAPDYLNKEWAKGVQEIDKGLGNDNQRAMLKKRLDARYINLDGVAQTHMAGQMRKYDEDSTKAYMNNAQNEAALNYADPKMVDLSLFQQESALFQYARRNGLSEEEVKQGVSEIRTRTHVAVLNQILSDGQADIAKDYFEKNKNAMTPEDRLRVGAAVDKQYLIVESQRKADELMALSGGDFEKAYSEARKIDDPQMKDAVDKEIKAKVQEQNNAVKMAKEIEQQRMNKNIYQTADDLLKNKLTEASLEHMVVTGQLDPEAGNIFKVAMSSPSEWKEIENDPELQAKGGLFYFNAINAMDKGADVSSVMTNAVGQYINKNLNKTDLAWVMKAVAMRNEPEKKSIWNNFVATTKAAMRNFGASATKEYMNTWDFKKDPKEHYKDFLSNVVAGVSSIDAPPKYLINAYGFMQQLFDGEDDAKPDAK